MDYLKQYNIWLESDKVDKETKDELLAISGNEREIKDRFYKHLEFGTGGLRGIIGAGTNRMNKYVIRRATQGIADYIKEFGGSEGMKRGVVIAYDCRHFSDVFALEAALVFAANGILVYLFDELRPTPELSFAVRHLGAIAGVNITASHNPPKYNGYKVYWEDGGQIPPHVSDVMLDYINKQPMFEASLMEKSQAQEKGLLKIIGEKVDQAFIDAAYKQVINKDAIERVGDTFKLIYTPLHGAANKPVRRILQKAGFKNILVVKEQELPDGSFPTVQSPNPENKECFELAIELAKRENVDLIIGTDPDGDRVGIVVRNKNGEYVTMSGNQVGAMLTHYILTAKAARGLLKENSAVVTTIVSTMMTKKICKKFGVKVFETLTGFKFIGEKILEFEKNNSYEYVFGFEESYGYLAGTHARDKDAVVTSMLIAEMAAYYAEGGKTLYEVMEDMYGEYGGFAEETVSITMEGFDGVEKIQAIMEKLRSEMPKEFGELKVREIRDYLNSTAYNLQDGGQRSLDLAKSNVMYFELSQNAAFIARPSGTEPKIKMYYLTAGETKQKADETLANVVAAVEKKLF